VRSADERGAIAAADDYVRAFAASDWPAACAARTRADQASLAGVSGTCPRAFAAIGRRLAQNKSPQSQPAAFATFRPSSVARRGGVIGVHFQSKDYRDELKFAAVRDGARWRVTDIPDARIP
jgi:hypothetical protein